MAKKTKSYAENKRDIISLLEIELGIIEDGGYGRSPRSPQKPKSMFQYSVSCINHWIDPNHPPDTCEGCILLDFVPPSHKDREAPCHFIPLNEVGETVDSLEQAGDQQRLEQVVADWLRTTLRRLKAELKAEDESAPTG
ncbi:MAG: hypothetical protein AB1898_03110 [Acidobacteriota bacterium]